MKTTHILSLGAGVQSTTLYLMFLHGEITPQIDCAIFADTGEEPESVYEHLEWLKAQGGPPILVRHKEVGRYVRTWWKPQTWFNPRYRAAQLGR